MIVEEKELEICLVHALKPLLKIYDIDIFECHINIEDHIYLKGIVKYQDTTFDVKGYFDLSYYHDCFCFEHIVGKIRYLFLNLEIINVLKQFVNSPYIQVNDKNCYVKCPLPISKITSCSHQLLIELKSTSSS